MTTDYQAITDTELSRLGVRLSSGKVAALAQYCSELARWNRRINLTGLDGRDLVRRLVAAPVWVAKELKMTGTLVDVGSGNGSPAIPIHVAAGLNGTRLIEARLKRAAFLRHVVTSLNLKNVEVHHSRFEEVVSLLTPPDWITVQAVAPTPQLIDTMKLISSATTTIVWITGDRSFPFEPILQLQVPNTEIEVFVFRLDLS